jgi:1,4-alpha-glucan branching enzyme
MVGLCRPLEEGGLGFDYRLAMGVPDLWIKLLREKKDEEWHIGDIYGALTNRRRGEKHIAYAESHDQALVGDKSIAFWLMDADMYWHMHKDSRNPVIDRGVALHKMIRLVTFLLGGEGYLNFMGNEFGHPEWVDFPRQGNNNSFRHARRQWSLVEHDDLRYGYLAAFDRAMLNLDERYNLLSEPFCDQINIDERHKLLVCRRGDLVAAFNFHPDESRPDYRFGVPAACDYELVLNTDDPAFGGFGAVAAGQAYPWQDKPSHGRGHSIQIYLPARTAQVLAPKRR